MKFPKILTTTAALLLLSPISGGERALAADEDDYAPSAAIVELFTSQGCYSCPPAEAMFRKNLVGKADIIPLEFHVDYWDDLVHGGVAWKDPFSNRDYTRRQTIYNRKLRQTHSVFTPQAVILGHSQTSGTNRDGILHTIRESLKREPLVRFRFTGVASEGNRLRARAEGKLRPGSQVVYALYWKERVTEVLHGENKGKSLVNSNVVYDLRTLPYGKRDVTFPELGENEGCAIWIQRGNAGLIESAARCPG